KRRPYCKTGDHGYSYRLCHSNRSGRQRSGCQSRETWGQRDWAVEPSGRACWLQLVMFNADNTQPALEMGATQAEARRLGLEIIPLAIRRAEDIAPAFQDLKTKADAVYLAVDQLIVANRSNIIALAAGERLPTISGERDFVRAGSLMSYGPNFLELFRRA